MTGPTVGDGPPGHKPDGDDTRRAARRIRGERRETLRDVSRRPRCQACGRKRIPGKAAAIRLSPSRGAAWSGVETCGSVWACPVCSARIRQARAVVLSGALQRWIEAGHGAVFVTLTLAHRRADALADLLGVVSAAYRGLLSGRPYRADRDRWGIVGNLRSLEVTDGRSGWHPHLHVLVLTETPLTERAAADLCRRWYRRWDAVVQDLGGRPVHPVHGVTAQRVGTAGVARYLSKVQDEAGTWRDVGMELTRGDAKSGRRADSVLPFQLLDVVREWADAHPRLDVAQAPAPVRRAVARWREYEDATAGRSFLRPSRGLLGRLGIAEWRADEDLAAADDDDSTLLRALDRDEWLTVRRTRGGLVALLVAAEDGGLASVDYRLRLWRARLDRRDRRELARAEALSRRRLCPPAPARPAVWEQTSLVS